MFTVRKFKQFLKLNFTFRRIAKFLGAVLIVMLVFALLVPLNFLRVVNDYYDTLIYNNVSAIPETRVAIVFGAGLSADGEQPSSILADRIMSAVELYKAGKVEKILMSGDNRFENYNEPQVMVNYAIANGVNALDLQADYAGRRTYDTCYRAKYIFGVEKAILITQDFHLPRALYTCNSLGIESIGFSADLNQYTNQDTFALRDFAATILAYWELHVAPPNVVLGDRINF